MWKVASVAVVGSFLAQLDATIVNVSLSSLTVQLHSSLATIQWVTSGYLLALALVLPLNGWLVDRIGARAVYLWCFSGFTLASAVCGLAWSAPSLIAFRVLQGVCGGLLAPMAQMMIARTAGDQMSRVLGLAALPIVLAPVLGPVIAGAILQYASWRWLFLVNLPVGVLAVVLALVFLPEDRDKATPRRLDLLGLALLSPALVAFLYGLDHVRDSYGAPVLAGALLLIAIFLRRSAGKGDAALIDLHLFRTKAFSASVFTQFMSNGVAFAGQMLVPIYLMRACGRSPSETGWLLAPLGLGMMCTYPLMGAATRRFGVRRVAATGALLSLVGTLPFIFLAGHGVMVPLLAGTLFVRGIGMSSVGIPSVSSAYAGLPRDRLPMASTALNIVQRLGGPTLTTVCATFLAWRLGQDHGASAGFAFQAAFILLCALHAGLFVATLRLPWSAEGVGRSSNVATPAQPRTA